MRIVAISDLYPPDIRGGAEVSTKEVVDGLRERGHDVVVATGAHGCASDHVRECLQYRPSPRWQGGEAWLRPWRAATDYRRSFHNRHNEGVLRELLVRVMPDVVYVNGVSGVGPCSVLRVLNDHPGPVVAHLRDYWLLNLLRGQGDAARLQLSWLKRLLIGPGVVSGPWVTSMITATRMVRDRHLQAKFAPDAVEVIPTGLHLPAVRQRRGPVVEGELRLLFVGRLDPEKGAHLLLERLAVVLPEGEGTRIRCDFVGPPGPPRYMRRLHKFLDAKNLGRCVRLLGSVASEEMRDLYARYDAVVVPSVWQEPFSRVVPEALAGGAAVIASRRVGAAEWFEDGRELLLFSPETRRELDDALRRLRDEPGLAACLADAALRKARQVFAPERFLSQMERYLEEATTRPKRSPLLARRQALGRPSSGADDGRRRAA